MDPICKNSSLAAPAAKRASGGGEASAGVDGRHGAPAVGASSAANGVVKLHSNDLFRKRPYFLWGLWRSGDKSPWGSPIDATIRIEGLARRSCWGIMRGLWVRTAEKLRKRKQFQWWWADEGSACRDRRFFGCAVGSHGGVRRRERRARLCAANSRL